VLSIKDAAISEGKGLSSADKGGGKVIFFRCRQPHFLMQKNCGFFEIYGVFTVHTDRRVEPVHIFFGQ